MVRGLGHAILRRSLLGPPAVELAALVVAKGARGRGHGERLFHAAEAWAVSQKLESLRLRSRLERADAHRSYRARRCRVATTPQRFVRELAGRPDPEAGAPPAGPRAPVPAG